MMYITCLGWRSVDSKVLAQSGVIGVQFVLDDGRKLLSFRAQRRVKGVVAVNCEQRREKVMWTLGGHITDTAWCSYTCTVY